MKVNTYQAPKWRMRAGDPSLPCPKPIQRLLNHIFPDPKDRRYVVNWMRLALLGRNETYLCLNGKKGLGKGILADYLIPALVGRDHYTPAPVGIFTGQFNAVLDKKRAILFDEFKVGKGEHTKLKRMINKYQNIEKKGVDADRRKETYNSYIISNNDVSDMFLEYDDRRFSVPEINTKRLNEVISGREIADLVTELEDDDSDLVWQWGYWVFYHGEATEYDQFSFLAGPHFWKIVYSSLYEWQKFIVDKLVTEKMDVIEVRQAQREFAKDAGLHSTFPRSITKIEEFLENYLHEAKYQVGRVGKNDEGDWVIYRMNEESGEGDL